MSHDMLAVIWFGLWGVIWTVYFILDGYALGNGMIFSHSLRKTDKNEINYKKLLARSGVVMKYG